MTLREQYPSGPLQLVAAEFGFPFTPALGPSAFERLTDALRERLPIAEQGELQTVRVVPGNPVSTDVQKVHRFLNRSRTTAVTVSETRAVVETTDYQGWGEFQPTLEFALTVLGKQASIVGFERLGL